MVRRKQRSLALPWEPRRGVGRLTTGLPRTGVALLLLVAVGGSWWMVREGLHRARVRETRAAIAVAHEAVQRFRDREGRCPRNMGEVLRGPSGTRYLREAPRDAWGQLLWVRCHGHGRPTDIEVVSAGADGSFFDGSDLR